ncbi:MAG TPA: hypothetical protein V6C65_24725 [Allocoleopsis sp.]
MGGIGSGGSRKTRSHDLVEQVPGRDVRFLRRHGIIAPNQQQIVLDGVKVAIEWSQRSGVCGGLRAYFRCPQCVNRCEKLHHHYGCIDWKCRRCHRLMYRSSLESRDRLSRSACRAYKIRVRLGAPTAFTLTAIPDKPKKMRWKTYDRLLERLFEEHRRSNLALMARFKQITGADLKPLA